MPNVTVVIPIGPAHEAVAERAIASVRAQTVLTELIVVHDTERRGPGWARNQGLAEVQTPYVVFLDADDWLEPQFIERTLTVRKTARYVFTDWYQDDVHVAAPRVERDGQIISVPDKKPWCARTWHAITALIPTKWVRGVGGFDEHLPGAEDTDFFLKLVTRRECGQRLAEPLFHYTLHPQSRAHQFETLDNYRPTLQTIHERYRGQMGCCGDDIIQPPAGEKQPGDVQAMALWAGNKSVIGYATGRMYPRTGNGKTAWVSPADVAKRPDMWRAVEVDEPTVDEPEMVHGVEAIADMLMPQLRRLPVTEIVPDVAVRPDVARVLRLGKL